MLPLSTRRSYLYRLVELMRLNESDLVRLVLDPLRGNHGRLTAMQVSAICQECGKTVEDAKSELLRSINVVEAAISVSSTRLGYHWSNEYTETYTINEPLVG